MTSTTRSFAATLAVAALALSGCATQPAADDVPAPTSLTWGWALPTSWDPVTSVAGWDTHALALVYDGLTQLDPEGEVVPGLAESWTYADDGTAVTFTLRDGLVFADGTPIDADAVKANLERGRDQADSTLAGQLKIVTGVDAVDERTVTVHLDQADYQVPYLFAGKTGFIVNPAAFDDPTTLATQPEGSGPFELVEYVPNAHADLVKSEEYWNADRIHIDEFRIAPVTDPATVVAGVQTGQWDVALIPPSQVQASESAGLEVERITALTVRTIDVNNTVAPYDDPRVLQAISHATDRQALVDGAYFGEGTPNFQPFPEGYSAYDADLEDLYPYDPDEARELLAEAGHPDGIDVELGITEADSAIAEVLQAQWADAGIRATLTVLPPNANNYINRTYPFVLDSFSGRQSPLQALEVLYGPEGLMNLGRNTPDELIAAIDTARATPTDADDYEEKLQDAVAIAVEQMPNTFLFTWPRILVHPAKVTGIQHWIDVQRWEDVTIEE
ncbi:ABC transporter substrate-binding protein [Microbacterium sp. SLBN-146]|uniref:ABC transporter substrate-binding protein n=1 Tax=Microbacterium sp. SLBN-146 TaxID=2768457 RepID=UPI001173AC73|nr:ABC transporter substrate-binding protein [Microbacterium sp. SLBN-146]TQJ29857.1 peptide/nickel transport system substrate-binding protein [Microbacterium sp. SLBN-146]